jgi:biotin transport system substrate-specific component
MKNITIPSVNIILFHKVIRVLLGVVAMAAMSNIAIPMQPISITLSTVMVMAIGLVYTKGEALATIGSYLAAGAMGAPVFMNFGSTLAHIIGPSGGYLFGYLLAVYVMTNMREKFELSMLYNCVVGHIFIYIPGVLWLATYIGMESAIYKGFIVYIPTGIIKIVGLVALLKIVKR